VLKSQLRKKVLKIRKNANKDNLKIDFNKVFSLIKKNNLFYKKILSRSHYRNWRRLSN